MSLSSSFCSECLPALKKSPFFSDLSDEEIEGMLRGFRQESWKKRSSLPPMQVQERFHVLLKGRIEMIKIDPETGRAFTVSLLKPGDVFDVITLLDGKTHDITVQALDEVMMLSVPMATVREWIDQHPAFNRTFLPYLGKQMRTFETLAADLALHNTVTRLSKLIVQHAGSGDECFDRRKNPVRLIHNLSHEALARMAGSVRVVVSRHIQHWKAQEAIGLRRRKRALRDLEEVMETFSKDEPLNDSKDESLKESTSH